MNTVEIIKNSKKIKTVDDIIKNIDLLVDLMIDDVSKILQKNNIKSPQDFNDYYSEAAKKLKNSLQNKQYLKGVKRFFNCGDVEQALYLFLRKLTSNVRNEMSLKRGQSIAIQKKKLKHQVEYMDHSDPLDLIIAEEEQELQQQNQEQEIERLHQMVQNNEISAEKSSAGHAQLFFNL